MAEEFLDAVKLGRIFSPSTDYVAPFRNSNLSGQEDDDLIFCHENQQRVSQNEQLFQKNANLPTHHKILRYSNIGYTNIGMLIEVKSAVESIEKELLNLRKVC